MVARIPTRLLAKSCHDPNHPPSAARYTAHTVAVVSAAKTLVELRGSASLEAVGLPQSLLQRLLRLVLVGALVHDLGKASADFQAMVRGGRAGQLVRHEAVSVWLAWSEPLRSWLLGALERPSDLALALAASAGHHRKFPNRAIDGTLGRGDRARIYSGHADVRKLLSYGAKVLGLQRPPQLFDCDLVIPMGGRGKLFVELEEAVCEALEQDGVASALLSVAKALILNADVAGSALPRVEERQDWIARQLQRRADGRTLLEARLGGNALRPFQLAVAASASKTTLVEAGCGNGKTLAAYAWFARQHAGRQLWFTYPTTGTALEGFRGYLYAFDGLAADLVSSRRELDLELCGANEAFEREDALRDADRIDSLRSWGMEAIACTVDTVLGLVQNQRRGLYAWSGLARAAVVFDEIHAYDERLFGCLIQFLKRLPGVPVLLMTASLPRERKEVLEKIVLVRDRAPLRVITGDADLESFPRYRFVNESAWQLTRETLARGGKVLWVSNTVNRCLEVAKQAERFALPARVYHSRFKYEDRLHRHQDVMEGFNGPGSCLAITTQVAEMSLDLSADLLVTDVAPVPALIQRLGRLNRRSSPRKPNGIKPAVVLPVKNRLPYEDDQLSKAEQWVGLLAARDSCSQRDLVNAWTSFGRALRNVQSAWFDGGLTTEPKEVREGSDGITVLMEEDIAAVRADSVKAIALALPMPPPRDNSWLAWDRDRVRYLPVAPHGTIQYDRLRGAQWQK